MICSVVGRRKPRSMKLNEIATGQTLAGVEVNEIVTVVAAVPHGDAAVQLIYRTPMAP